MKDIELFSKFESIGDSCEFAFVQKQAGIDQPSLLRWASIPSVDCLVNVLEKNFEGLFDFENLRPYVGGLVKDIAFNGIGFHSAQSYASDKDNHVFTQPDEMRRAIHAREQSKIEYLTNVTLENLRGSKRIFIFKRNSSVSDADASRVFAEVQKFNKANVLVVVRPSGPEHPPGSIVPLSTNLLVAYIDRFAPYERSTETSMDGWRMILQNIYAELGRGDELTI